MPRFRVTRQQFTQLRKHLRQAWRKHGALAYLADRRTAGQKISERSRRPRLHCPLRAVSVAEWRRSMLLDRPFPLDPANPRKRLAQNLRLPPERSEEHTSELQSRL